MLYCDSCQVLSQDEETCPRCGGHKLRPVTVNDPVLLFTAWEQEAEHIAAAFDDEGIPHMERVQEGGSASTILLGRNRCTQVSIFVPFGEIEHACDVMRGIHVLNDDAEEDSKAGNPESSKRETADKKDDVPMSRGKRIAVRIFSVIAFILLIWAVVSAADTIVNGFKSMFH